MNEVWLIYKTDAHHSYDSRDIIGIATEIHKAHILILNQVAKEGQVLTKDQMWNLTNLKQTQGYSGEGEFQYELVKTDILL